MTNKLLAKAIEIATQAHSGQFDRGGRPYILHPLHLMTQALQSHPEDVDLAIIAVLHDVVEDSDWELDSLILAGGFSQEVRDALFFLTHQDGETYEDYISAMEMCTRAVIIKRLDIEHNSCITRLKGVRQKDLDRIEKYHTAYLKLGEYL